MPNLSTPLCLGWPCRCILLPIEATSWDSTTLEMVIQHEECHIKRQDHAWIHLAHLLCIVQWFNPLAWLLARRLRFECENVADNTVLNLGVNPTRYAELLLSFQSTKPLMLPLSAAQPIYRRSGLARRLESILSSTTRRNPMNRKTAILIALAVTSGCIVVSGFTFAKSRHQLPFNAHSSNVQPAAVHFPEYSVQREVQVVQVGTMDGKNRIVWDSNGNLVPDNQVIEHKWQPDRYFAVSEAQAKKHANPHARYRHIVFRVRALPTDGKPEAWFEADPGRNPNSPGLGVDLPTEYLMTKDGWHYLVPPHATFPIAGNDIPLRGQEDASGSLHVTLTKPVDQGSTWQAPHFSKWTAEPASKPQEMSMEESIKLSHSDVWSKVSISHPSMIWQKAHFFKKDGSEIPDSLVSYEYLEGPSRNHILPMYYYVGVAPTELGDVRVTTRKSVNVNVSSIPMSPRKTP